MKLTIFISLAFLIFSCAATFGVYHRVKKGDTLYDISKLYGTSVDKLMENNNIADKNLLNVGEYIWISDVKAPKIQAGSTTINSNTKQEPEQDGASQVSPSNFIWPSKGVLTSKFGKRWGRMHEGIDIGCPEGTPIFAANNGKVIFSGQKGGYGKVIIIQHSGNWFTVYAHASKNLVGEGQTVKKGQKISLSGNTGRSTGPHLHFEIRKGAKPVDPLKYLPKTAP